MFQQRSIRLTLGLAAALSGGACGDDPASPPGEATIADYVASASIGAAEGELRTSRIPRPTSEGPPISVDGHLTIVNGGTAQLDITSETPFQTVYVAGSSPIFELFVPVSGFFEIALPAPTTSAELIVSFPQSLPGDDFDLYFSAADPAGNVGTLAEESFEVLSVGTGDVQVTVSWDADSDVDLHVVDPGGWEIFWGAPQSPSGGALDLDSNAICIIDGIRNENITWPEGTAPQGTYTVRVDYWSSCDVPQTDWTVLINNGGEIEIYRGTFYGLGDGGGLGSGIEVATFTRTAGPTATMMPTELPLVPASKSGR